jgi:hypothetical protein
MKLRNGFVSNSSSSSFVLSKHFVSEYQLEKIRNHIEVAKDEGWVEEKGGQLGWPEPWDISENEHEVMGDTFMDNFDMEGFLERIGVPKKFIHMNKDG